MKTTRTAEQHIIRTMRASDPCSFIEIRRDLEGQMQGVDRENSEQVARAALDKLMAAGVIRCESGSKWYVVTWSGWKRIQAGHYV